MDGQPEIPFLTDDQIVGRLKQLENGLLHIQTSAGSMAREAALRQLLEPRDAAAALTS